MSPQSMPAAILAISYFAAVIVGAHQKLLSIIETKMLIVIGIIGVIVVSLLLQSVGVVT